MIRNSALQVEVNAKQWIERDILVGRTHVLMTPPIDADYWLVRVPVTATQAIVGFPKFGTIGVGFQHEADWNANLPYSCEAVQIWEHIRHNKNDKRITRKRGVAAIELLQQTLRELRHEQPFTCNQCGQTTWMRPDETTRKGCTKCQDHGGHDGVKATWRAA